MQSGVHVGAWYFDVLDYAWICFSKCDVLLSDHWSSFFCSSADKRPNHDFLVDTLQRDVRADVRSTLVNWVNWDRVSLFQLQKALSYDIDFVPLRFVVLTLCKRLSSLVPVLSRHDESACESKQVFPLSPICSPVASFGCEKKRLLCAPRSPSLVQSTLLTAAHFSHRKDVGVAKMSSMLTKSLDKMIASFQRVHESAETRIFPASVRSSVCDEKSDDLRSSFQVVSESGERRESVFGDE